MAEGSLPGYLWLPDSGHGPGLVLCQEIFGVSEYIRDRAADLADLGYVVLAPEFYHRLPAQSVDETRDDFLQQALALAGEVDWETAVGEGVAALEWLSGQDDVVGNPGLIGFCFGGGLAFAIAAEGDPSTLVSYYGSALPGLLGLADRVRCPQLHHFGESDSYIAADQVAAIEEAVTAGGKTEFHTYPGADHAFDNPHPQFHHATASAAAWSRTVEFLSRTLP
ncbi:dienelactone hydrolase family protein [Arthrobacter echini]|uniref:Dienelactone hydrolase family protein n=2 Tax=Arthrobacter echini TaxID=1529066 RepID=A0A4S5E2A4_9MICC|nr:dienelactone hydrolase family protein [Arthrobacter echini]